MHFSPVRFSLALLAFAVLFAGPVAGNTLVPPITSGPYPVGSTNFEVTSLPTSEMELRLIGSYTATGGLYTSDILLHPADCPTIDVDMPTDPARFGLHSGTRVKFVAYVLYPTRDDNTRPDYVFPYTNTGDHTFPHMQRAGEAPIFRNAGVRYPLIVYTSGYNCHGLWDLGHMKLLASQGYIVLVIQHGDGRNTFGGCIGERPFVVSRFLDYLLAHPVFGPAIDRERIGISGSSMGGYTTLAVAGGGCYASPNIPPDSRIHAAFGLVPLVGGVYGTNPFGSDYASLSGVRCPFFAVYAQNDTSVPKATVEAALPNLKGTCTGVMLFGETHSLTGPAYVEAQTYEILFFDAWLRDNQDSKDLLYSAMNVAGTVSEARTFQHIVAPEEVDDDAAFGNCPPFLRLLFCGNAPGVRVAFPASVSGSYRYDLLASPDLLHWQCLRTGTVPTEPGDKIPAWTPPAGFQWRVVEPAESPLDEMPASYFRVRVSR